MEDVRAAIQFAEMGMGPPNDPRDPCPVTSEEVVFELILRDFPKDLRNAVQRDHQSFGYDPRSVDHEVPAGCSCGSPDSGTRGPAS